jgi:peptide/nickel transport system permease protein
MWKYILNRLLFAVPTLIAITVLVFTAIRLVPGDPVLNQIGLSPDKVAAAALRAQLNSDYGLDQPLPVQYLKWLGHVVRGDWGESLFTHRAVLQESVHRLPISLELLVLSMVSSLVLATVVGVVAALRRGSGIDFGLMLFTALGISAPEFLVGTVLIYIFALKLGWFQAAGFARIEDAPLKNIKALLLPGLSLGFARAALLTRLVRAEVLETLSQDFVRTARAKGLRERMVMSRHALKNAMLPVVTVAGLQIGAVLGGSVIVESLFVLPGMGTYGINALQKRDYPAIEGFVLLIAVGFLLANLLVDVLYGYLDPRIRLSRAGGGGRS